MAGIPLDYDLLRFEWGAFFGLLSNDKGIKLRISLPDTLILRHGEPLTWVVTSEEGYVVQRSAARSTMDDVRQHLVSCSLGSNGNYSQYVAIMRLDDGLPKLLTQAALEALCTRLAAQKGEAEHLVEDSGSGNGRDGGVPTPCVLQAYVAPFLDLRFVTSYTNDGANISCHTFQRRFSRRYLQYRDPTLQPQPQPDALAGSATARQLGAPPAATEAASASSGHPGGSGLGAGAAGGGTGAAASSGTASDPAAEVTLDDAALADSERSLNKTLGPVDPSLKMIMRKAAHGLVQYVQRTQLLTLRGMVCEFVRDSEGRLWFLGPLRCDWASLIPGRGGEPWANANLTQQAQDEESWPSTINDEVFQEPSDAACASSSAGSGGGGSCATDPQQQQQHRQGGSALHLQQQQQQPAVGLAQVQQGGCGISQSGQAAEGSYIACSPAAPASDSGPPSVVQQLVQRHQAPPQLRSPGMTAPSATPALPGLPGAGGMQSRQPDTPAMQRSSPQHQQHPLALKTAFTQSPVQAWQKERSPGGSPSGTRQQVNAAPPGSSGSHWGSGIGAYSPPRGTITLTSHLTKELVTLKDELLTKTDLADALASKVAALEHDKHVVTTAFERVLEGMQGDLEDVKGRLEALRQERDRLLCQLGEARQKLSSTEAERGQLRAMLDVERGTAFISLGEFQKQQEDSGVRAAQAEAQLHSLKEQLREERAACDALKKQMVFYQHGMSSAGLGDAGGSLPGEKGEAYRGGALGVLRGQDRPEIKYVETLQAVDELLLREADPSGERYSLSKVLHTCQGDLHAIFLHYCMLDAGFVRHWPPQLTLHGWLSFMKDIGSTNLVPGMRTRNDSTMHVQEATEVFRRYCLRQAIMKGTLPLRVSSFRDPAAAPAAPPGTGDLPVRPPSSQSTTSGMASSRPFSASVSPLAGASMSYQSFCAALVHVAAKLARGSAELMEAFPFLSEQTRAFVESILPKAQQVGQTSPSAKKGAVAAAKPSAGVGAKEAAAKEAAAKLPKLKKGKKAAVGTNNRAGDAGAEMSAIAEASREGSGAAGSLLS